MVQYTKGKRPLSRPQEKCKNEEAREQVRAPRVGGLGGLGFHLGLRLFRRHLGRRDADVVDDQLRRRSNRRRRIDDADANCLGALAAFVGLGGEGHLLAGFEPGQAGIAECRDVDEHVLAAVGRDDEAVTLRRVEKFHDAAHAAVRMRTHAMPFP